MTTQHQTQTWTVILKKVKKIINIISVKKKRSIESNNDQKDNDWDSVNRMTYGRIVQKLDRLAC